MDDFESIEEEYDNEYIEDNKEIKGGGEPFDIEEEITIVKIS